jgi:hypothetical protein
VTRQFEPEDELLHIPNVLDHVYQPIFVMPTMYLKIEKIFTIVVVVVV